MLLLYVVGNAIFIKLEGLRDFTLCFTSNSGLKVSEYQLSILASIIIVVIVLILCNQFFKIGLIKQVRRGL